MRVAYVFSDLTYPAQEGLHQQSLLLIRSLLDRGVELDIFGFVKNRRNLDHDRLARDMGIRIDSASVVESPGSTLVTGLRARYAPTTGSTRLRRRLIAGNYSVIHLEGAAAAGVLRRSMAERAVVSMVDPGSRRNVRFALLASGFSARVSYLGAAVLFYLYERASRMHGAAWHVVSESDARYLARAHRRRDVHCIPVMLPPDIDRAPRPSGFRPHPVQTVVVFADLRQPSGREAFHRFTATLQPSRDAMARFRFRVLGRSGGDRETRTWSEGLATEFLPWVPDYVQVLREADVVVLPDIVGTGIKNRSVQALALGRPTIGTKVAFEGIPVRDGENALIVSDDGDFGKALARFGSMAQGAVQALSDAAYSTAHAEFGVSAVTARWLALYEKVSCRSARATGDGSAETVR